ncbi:enolase C-terminal domain-like protein [Inquilinus limosus]|uniref:Mandelate racemase n=1 Tax=Inquilinus limosus MP06 TaxID=1398085 RepID=A0A0A0D2J0_9PROT|nr:enolase C-terminal domain-like protein [Inquilinus limosus]KGM32230.1 mandelate racemase [Inquilinus limosus MP06]
MRIVDIRERSVPISRYADPAIPSGGLTTSIVAVVTDVVRDGWPVVGWGFGSIGRFAQGGLIRERFAPRLLAASLADAAGTNLDPFRAWAAMMAGEKPGGHGERCVAVGTLDMALWDAAAKIAGLPLHRFLADRLGQAEPAPERVPVYAGGGYLYPQEDLARLGEEMHRLADLGYTRAKIKIGTAGPARDLRRIEVAAAALGGPGNLAVDAMNAYDGPAALEAAAALAPLGLWWFEDVCDPHDFPTQAAVTAAYPGPVASGEALFSAAEARLLARHGGLRPDRDILLFDPVHCYGLPGFLQIVDAMTAAGWPRRAFWPHGGHLFTLHVVAALGLGGAEVNPLCFHPFGGLGDDATVSDGLAGLPQLPGIGFESRAGLHRLFGELG